MQLKLKLMKLCRIIGYLQFYVLLLLSVSCASEIIDPEKPVHTFRQSSDRCVLRAPATLEEWKGYHAIRKAEIHERYCPDKTYNPNSKEELLPTNFRFVLVDTSSTISPVIGAIRVDLHENKEASFRWVAIEKSHQRKGWGKEMMGLAESFVLSQKRMFIRIPAATDSQAFYEKLGYQMAVWQDGPKCVDTVPLTKKLMLVSEEKKVQENPSLTNYYNKAEDLSLGGIEADKKLDMKNPQLSCVTPLDSTLYYNEAEDTFQ